MIENFFVRLRNYYIDVAKVLRGEAEASCIFPNSTDKGMVREKVYAEFLQQHVPSKCNVFLGGFIFDEDGNESKQIDIIVTTDTTPCFKLGNNNGFRKSFSPVEGTLAAISVKSNLDKKELYDALNGISSIPPTRSLENRLSPLVRISNYSDWPLKIIYASGGISAESIREHMSEFFNKKNTIPLVRQPDFIHVAGKYLIIRADSNMAMYIKNTGYSVPLEQGNYYTVLDDADLSGIVWVLDKLQERASASTHIIYRYDCLINKTIGLPL